MSDPQMTAERRTAILESLGRKEGDVMEDENGGYVMVEHNHGVGEDGNEQVEWEKLYLSDVELD